MWNYISVSYQYQLTITLKTPLIDWLSLYSTTIELRLINDMNTRNKFLSVILFITLIGMSNHPLAAQTMARAGIKGGFNASKIYIDNTVDGNALIGFHAGVYGQLFSSKSFAIQPELLFSTKGYKAQYTELTNQEIKYKLNYLDLPILAVIKLGDAGEIHLGGYASYLLSATISYEPNLGSGINKISKDDLKSYDYGLSGGLGINFGNFQIGARYNFGLVSLADSDAAKVLLGDAKSSCTQLYASFNMR
jgi:Outer membrane protein beta-barrel domain